MEIKKEIKNELLDEYKKMTRGIINYLKRENDELKKQLNHMNVREKNMRRITDKIKYEIEIMEENNEEREKKLILYLNKENLDEFTGNRYS